MIKLYFKFHKIWKHKWFWAIWTIIIADKELNWGAGYSNFVLIWISCKIIKTWYFLDLPISGNNGFSQVIFVLFCLASTCLKWVYVPYWVASLMGLCWIVYTSAVEQISLWQYYCNNHLSHSPLALITDSLLLITL